MKNLLFTLALLISFAGYAQESTYEVEVQPTYVPDTPGLPVKRTIKVKQTNQQPQWNYYVPPAQPLDMGKTIAESMADGEKARSMALANQAERQRQADAAAQRRIEYEKIAVNNPEQDFNRGFFEKIKIKEGKKKYTLNFFRPEAWQKQTMEHPEWDLFLSRVLSDGTIVRFWIGLIGKDIYKLEYPGLAIKKLKNDITDAVSSITITDGVNYENNAEGFSIIKKMKNNSSLYLAGAEKEDIIYSINGRIRDTEGNKAISSKKLYEDYNEGDDVDVVLIRGSDTIPGLVKLQRREGFYSGDINISSYPGVFYTEKVENEVYGEMQKILRGNHYVVAGQNMLIVRYEITPKTTDGNLEFEFKRFKKSVISLLGNIKLE
tara:strand:- start:708 stop:1838 length:1131 start_codon:yes stop_codon:yes gene_type:complete